MAKKNEIIVKDVAIKTMSKDGIDYISITDIARQKNATDPNGVIANWMRNRNTVEFLGIWETLHNPNFNPLEFEGFRKEAGLNAFTLSPTRWIEATNAIGIVSQAGRYGGTFAQTDIAFEFASWISVEFRLYLVMEFQRLKAKEQELLGWTAKRELSKINYPYPYGCHQEPLDSRGNHPSTSQCHLCRRSRCTERRNVRNDRQAMARGKSRPKRQYP